MKKLLTIALTLAACALLVLTRPKAPQYRFAAVQVRTLTEKIETVGVVAPQRTCALMPTVAGRVVRVFVKEGQYVGRGQAVAEVELLPENAAAALSALQNADMSRTDVQEQLRKMCTVTSPQDGHIVGLETYVGQQVAPGSALGGVASEMLCVTACVPENLREALSIGQGAAIRRGDKELQGVVERITPAGDASGQYLVRIAPQGTANALEAGMKVDVELLVEACTAPAVPLQALQPDGTVRCLSDPGVTAVPVQTGLCTEMYAQLLSGPPVGTQVVVGEVQ